jgi:hypothetical protein
MEWFDDSIACLDVAENLLSDIEEKQKISISNEGIIPYIKVDIKNLLENCRSPLDYAAQFIFDKYCRVDYLTRERKKKKPNFYPRIYYPIRKDKKLFDEEINNLYFVIKQEKPEIIDIFKRGQHFSSPEDPFLYNLNLLTNMNKHRNLTKQERQVGTNVNFYKDENGNTFSNISSQNNNAFVIGGVPLGEKIIKAASQKQPVNATVWVEYFFKDLNKPVNHILKSIYEQTRLVINDLGKIV